LCVSLAIVGAQREAYVIYRIKFGPFVRSCLLGRTISRLDRFLRVIFRSKIPDFEGIALMLYQKFLTPGFLSAPFVVVFVVCTVLAISGDGFCIGASEFESPLYGLVICFNAIFYIGLISKLDPKFSRIRKSIILTIFFVWFFIFILSLSANFISPFLFDVLC
jgi:hypothetical protein